MTIPSDAASAAKVIVSRADDAESAALRRLEEEQAALSIGQAEIEPRLRSWLENPDAL